MDAGARALLSWQPTARDVAIGAQDSLGCGFQLQLLESRNAAVFEPEPNAWLLHFGGSGNGGLGLEVCKGFLWSHVENIGASMIFCQLPHLFSSVQLCMSFAPVEDSDMTKEIFTLDTLGARVRWLREKKKMKQNQLAKAAKISQPSMWAIEHDVTKPEKMRGSTLLRLAAVLDSTPEFIRDGKGDPHTATPGDTKELVDIYVSLPDNIKAALIATARALKG